MIEKLIKAIFWDPSEKKVKEISRMVEKIKEIEKEYEHFTLENVKAKTKEFKENSRNLRKNKIRSICFSKDCL